MIGSLKHEIIFLYFFLSNVITRSRKLMTLKTLNSDLKKVCNYDVKLTKMFLKNDLKNKKIFVLN
jgi:hypothetical protein